MPRGGAWLRAAGEACGLGTLCSCSMGSTQCPAVLWIEDVLPCKLTMLCSCVLTVSPERI